jgi:molecular chaperone IbpA
MSCNPKLTAENNRAKKFLEILLKSNSALLIRFLPPAGGAGRQLWVRRTEQGAAQVSCTGVLRSFVPILLLGDLAMRTYDFAPLWRSTIGFDRLFDLLDETQHRTEDNYPPYNIERLAEDRYQISLALAGFNPDEIAVTAEQNVLTVDGRKGDKHQHEYLYQGISARPFKRQFNLADYVQVKQASFDNGLLRIELVREIPEAMKPRRIAIGGGASNAQITQKAA